MLKFQPQFPKRTRWRVLGPLQPLRLVMVKVKAISVQILNSERLSPQGIFCRGSTMFEPNDFNSLYVASISSANTQ